MKKYSNKRMVRLRNVITECHDIMSEPIYKNQRSAKYSFLDVANDYTGFRSKQNQNRFFFVLI